MSTTNQPFDLPGVRTLEPTATKYFLLEVMAWLELTSDPRLHDGRVDGIAACAADFCKFMEGALEAGYESDWRRCLTLLKGPE